MISLASTETPLTCEDSLPSGYILVFTLAHLQDRHLLTEDSSACIYRRERRSECEDCPLARISKSLYSIHVLCVYPVIWAANMRNVASHIDNYNSCSCGRCPLCRGLFAQDHWQHSVEAPALARNRATFEGSCKQRVQAQRKTSQPCEGSQGTDQPPTLDKRNLRQVLSRQSRFYHHVLWCEGQPFSCWMMINVLEPSQDVPYLTSQGACCLLSSCTFQQDTDAGSPTSVVLMIPG